MLKLKVIRQILKHDAVKLSAVARGTELPYHAVRGLIKNTNPLYANVEKISDYIESNNLQLFIEKGDNE